MFCVNFEIKEYISKYETNKERPTKWLICPLSHRIKGRIQRMVTKNDYSNIDLVLEVIRFGLKGAIDFVHPQTKELIKLETVKISVDGYETMAMAYESLDLIHMQIIDELSEEISKLSVLSLGEKKN